MKLIKIQIPVYYLQIASLTKKCKAFYIQKTIGFDIKNHA